MSNLLEMPLVLAALAFTGGYVLAKVGVLLGRAGKTSTKPDTERDRQFRAMEAELRVARKQFEEAETSLVAVKQERGELQAQLDERTAEAVDATDRLTGLHKQLKEECEKTQKLRTELSQRAEQEIRTKIQLRDMETELSLAQAGSDAINDEINQLASEREELTEQLQQLQRRQAEEQTADLAAPNGVDLDASTDPEHPRRRHDDLVAAAHPGRRRSDLAFDEAGS